MPISKKERERLSSHKYSEDKKEEFGSVYSVVPEINPNEMLNRGLKALLAGKKYIAYNVPEGVVVTAYLYALFNSHSVVSDAWYTIGFILFQLFVSSILDAIYSTRISHINIGRFFNYIAIYFSYLEPLSYVIMIGMLLIATFYAKGILAISVLKICVIFVIGVIVAVLLHIANMNNSISIHLLSSEKVTRSVSVNKSWHVLSNQSLTLLFLNAVVFLPAAVVAVVYAFTISNYVLALEFILLVISISLWRAVVSQVYAYTKSNMKEFNYSEI